MTLKTDPIDLEFSSVDDDLLIAMDLNFTTGEEGVRQILIERFGTFKGEWFLELNEGMPYLENDNLPANDALLGGKFDELKTRQAARAICESTPGVAKVDFVTASFDAKTRLLTITFRVVTKFGDTIIQTVSPGV